MIESFEEVLEKAVASGPATLAVAPLSEMAVKAALSARALGLAIPCFIGNVKSYESLFEGTVTPERLIREEDPNSAVQKGIERIKSGQADILMQGYGEARSFIQAVAHRDHGLPLKGPLSYLSVYALMKRKKLILLTDTLVHEAPTLEEKRRIIETALVFSSVLEIPSPKVALLAAIEQVNPGIPSTLDAAILSKMAERGQFGDAVMEGPLDIDCALSERAASRKGVRSPVTGNVDIYMLPDLETGYALSELLVFVGGMPMAGILLGASHPLIPEHPAVGEKMKIYEIALAVLARMKKKIDG